MHCPYLIIAKRKNGEKPFSAEEIEDMLPAEEDMLENIDENIVDYVDAEQKDWPMDISYFIEPISEGLVVDRGGNTFVVTGDFEAGKKHLLRLMSVVKARLEKMAESTSSLSALSYAVRNALNDETGTRIYLLDDDGSCYSDCSFEEFLNGAVDREVCGMDVFYQLIGVYDYHY